MDRALARRLGYEAAFTEGRDLCASGFYHGVTEAVMASIGADRILDRADTVCAAQRNARRCLERSTES